MTHSTHLHVQRVPEVVADDGGPGGSPGHVTRELLGMILMGSEGDGLYIVSVGEARLLLVTVATAPQSCVCVCVCVCVVFVCVCV